MPPSSAGQCSAGAKAGFMSIPSPSRAAASGAAVPLVATLISIYIVSQFLRNSIGVIAPNLAAELALSPAEIGLLSSTFFLVFAAVQIPVGVALDRFGPRLCLLAGAAVTVAGTVVFAAATSPGALIAGRALLGLGTAGSLVASLAVYARRFSPERFATLTGLQVGIGTVGTLLATAPLALSAATIGWRASFLGVGAFTLLAGLLVALVVRGDARPHGGHETLRESLAGILAVMRTPSVGRLFVMNLVAYSTFGLVVGLWGAPYLTHIYGYSLQERGSFLLIPVLTQIAGSILWGPMDRVVGSHKLPVLLGAGTTAAALGYLALVGTLGPWMLVVWFAAFGFLSAFGPLLIAHGRALFPLRQIGRGLTVLNMGAMGGVFLAQAVSGFVIELFPTASDGAYELAAYQAVFALQAAFILLACLVYSGSRDPMRGRPGGRESAVSA
jgi:MFS family permease